MTAQLRHNQLKKGQSFLTHMPRMGGSSPHTRYGWTEPPLAKTCLHPLPRCRVILHEEASASPILIATLQVLAKKQPDILPSLPPD